MSMLDQLRALEQQVQQRLRELRPLVAEYRDLEKVAERLGLKRDDSEAAEAPSAKPAPRAARKAKPSRGRTRTPAAKTRASKRTATTRATKPTATSKPKPAATRKRAAKAKASARQRTAAAPGQRQQDVLRLVRERPGITVAEMAGELGVDATGLYGVVRRLQGKGQISKDGTRLRPVDETTPTSDVAAPPSAESTAGSPAATGQRALRLRRHRRPTPESRRTSVTGHRALEVSASGGAAPVTWRSTNGADRRRRRSRPYERR